MVHLLFQMSSMAPIELDLGALSATIKLLPGMAGQNNISSLIESEIKVKSPIEGQVGVEPKNG